MLNRNELLKKHPALSQLRRLADNSCLKIRERLIEEWIERWIKLGEIHTELEAEYANELTPDFERKIYREMFARLTDEAVVNHCFASHIRLPDGSKKYQIVFFGLARPLLDATEWGVKK